MYKKPQLRFFVVFAAFLAVFLIGFNPDYANAASGKGVAEGRYFVESKNVLIKSLFGVQHDFGNGFTSDLTSGEVWTLERIFKVNIVKVPLYKINAVSALDATASVENVVTNAVSLISDIDQKIKVREFFPDSQIPWGIKKIYGENIVFSTNGGKNVNIAVLDTGANVDHYDLSARIKDCKDFTRGPVPRSACEDKHGHGTHIAGIISADGGFDGKGIWGVASEANLLIYKVCRNDGTCWADDVASAVIYASKNGANIISLGLGEDIDSFLMKDAVGEAFKNNILIVASAGNDGPEKESIDFPASYGNVVSVGAFSEEGIVPEWSSRGTNDGDYIKESREIEFVSPGENIESSWIDGSYRYLSGSSIATPHIAGLAAKIWDGSATSTDAKLKKMARDVWTIGDDSSSGFGIPILPKTIPLE
jgi:subtilisin